MGGWVGGWMGGWTSTLTFTASRAPHYNINHRYRLGAASVARPLLINHRVPGWGDQNITDGQSPGPRHARSRGVISIKK